MLDWRRPWARARPEIPAPRMSIGLCIGGRDMVLVAVLWMRWDGVGGGIESCELSGWEIIESDCLLIKGMRLVGKRAYC